MSDDQNSFAGLKEKLSALVKRQESFQNEIEELRKEIEALASAETLPLVEAKAPENAVFTSEKSDLEMSSGLKVDSAPVVETPVTRVEEAFSSKEVPDLWKEATGSAFSKGGKKLNGRSNLEKFIGENLISKIGIVILIIGVGIGAKYAIDHDLISPLTRIILGYIVGLGLLGFAIRLKKQYTNFSAVLFSGSMAIMYFITFAAYSFFELFPAVVAFTLMVLFTLVAVGAAIWYDRQVIAHIGLVGAYAVPFLLSDGSGRVVILYTYMAIINAGILAISLRKYWKPLYYSSFLITWIIVVSWFATQYKDAEHFGLSWVFISIFFVTFYIIFLAYKLQKKEKFRIDDILLLLINSSVFYGLGYALLHGHLGGEKLQGLFTLGNGLIHLLVCILIYKVREPDKNIFYFTAGLFVAFLTISIPVELNGSWISMLWSVEAAVLFRIGRKTNAPAFEMLSYALMVLAFFGLIVNWPEVYHTYGEWPSDVKLIPLFNAGFLTSIIFIVSFGYINILNSGRQLQASTSPWPGLNRVMDFIIPGMLLIALYFMFYLEIETFWKQFSVNSMVKVPGIDDPVLNENVVQYKTISLLVYSLLFLSALSLVNLYRLKKSVLALVNLGFSIAAVGLFLTVGLIAFGTLRESYISQEHADYFYRGFMLVGLRYVCFGFLALQLYSVYRYVKAEFVGTDLKIEFDVFFHIILLTVLSNELINWMDLSGTEGSFKLGLSILFGLYSVFLIILGIWKKKLHLRISAIVLFSLTLLKLFFYDLSSLSTIGKTIVFIVLGVLLLVISFLYTKYRKVLFGDHEEIE
ncbi:MAG: DUF2339 domain-containing protein [Bacteroidota bacterium]